MPSRRFFVILLPWLAVIALAIVAGFRIGHISTDLTQLMPRGDAPEEHLLLRQLHEGPAARLILVALDGADSAELARISRRLRAALAEDPAFSWIENGELRLNDRSLETLYPLRYLLGPDAACRDDLRGEGLKRALEARLQELFGPFPPPDKSRFAADPTACFRALLNAWRPAIAPRRAQGVWFTRDGVTALLAAQTHAAASDLDAQQRALESIRKAFEQAEPDPRVHLQVAGPGPFAVGSRDLIRTQTTRLSLGGTLLVLLILGFAFHNPWLVLLGALPLASGVLAGVLVVQVVFGSIHGIALAMGATLLGVAVDYPLHVISHARFGTVQALRGIWRTFLLGVLTTALAYLALAFTDFGGLIQLGVLAVTGVLVTALTSRYLLPPMLVAVPRSEGERRFELRTRSPGAGRLAPILGGVLSGLLLVCLLDQGLPWETDLRRLSTVPSADIALDQHLRDELGAPEVSRLFYQWADSPEQALQSQERVRPALEEMIREGKIGGFEAASLLLPSVHTQRLRQAQLPATDDLKADLKKVLQGLPFRKEAFLPFIAEVSAAKAAEPMTLERLRGTSAGAKIGTLLTRVDQRWLSLVLPIGLKDDPHSIPTPPADMSYIDLTATSSALLDRFLKETLSMLGLSGAAILAVLLFGLRDPRRLGRILIVISLTLQLDLVTIILLDGGINLFHLVALVLVLGLSIDYSLFFTRPDQSPKERDTTFIALILCAFSSFAMFALLGLSSIPVLHAIGSTVAVGILLAFSLSWLLAAPASWNSQAIPGIIRPPSRSDRESEG